MTSGIGETVRRIAGNDKLRRWLLLLGAAGVLLIALSEWLPARGRQAAEETPGGMLTAAQVEQALEGRITELIRHVEGVGSCRVMVTLENGARFVYAADQTVSAADSASSSTQRILSVETETGPVGLLVTEIQPTVRGVAVVCAGGGDPAVRERVTSLVTAAFNISSRRVSVVKQQ